MDQGITLEITWQSSPMADMVLDMAERYRDGVLKCRKVIIPWIGGGSGPDLETWRIGWTGKGQDGLVGVGVNNFYGAKETALAWIDAIIPKIAKAK